MTENKIKPVYSFVEVETTDVIAPMQRKIAKTMEITEHFTLKDAFEYMGKMRKRISDLEVEIEGIRTMLNAYEEEVALIEEQLGVQKLEEDFRKAEAKEIING